MTMTAPVPVLGTSEISVVRRNVVGRREVKTMPTATAPNHTVSVFASDQYRTSGVDRAVERFAEALLRWSRHRAARNSLGSVERSALVQNRAAQLRRELDAERLLLHYGL